MRLALPVVVHPLMRCLRWLRQQVLCFYEILHTRKSVPASSSAFRFLFFPPPVPPPLVLALVLAFRGRLLPPGLTAPSFALACKDCSSSSLSRSSCPRSPCASFWGQSRSPCAGWGKPMLGCCCRVAPATAGAAGGCCAALDLNETGLAEPAAQASAAGWAVPRFDWRCCPAADVTDGRPGPSA